MIELTTEEIEFLKKFNISFPQLIPRASPPEERKILKTKSSCTLCKTITRQFIELRKTSASLWIKNRDLTQEEANEQLHSHGAKLEIYTTQVGSCWACRQVLQQLPVDQLIDLILKLSKPLFQRKLDRVIPDEEVT